MFALFLSFLLSGNVTSILDGDTIKVNFGNEVKVVRLACIDTPESKQPGGVNSTLNLYAMTPIGKTITVDPVTSDRYGRTIGLVYSGDKLINLELVKKGSAVIYEDYFKPCEFMQSEFIAAQESAKSNRLGFWGLPLDLQIMPWNWRKNN